METDNNSSEVYLMEGNEAIAEAAIRAGCNHFYGYPITPQNELIEYMSRRMPESGGNFLQAESELASIHMVFGAAAAGGSAMTSTSSPGISLMLEGISHLAAAELPCVVVDVMRAGPGNGNIFPSQSDYSLATKGGGHGDFHNIVLAPASVQDMADHIVLAFELAEKYRNPAMILSDGLVGHLTEKVSFEHIKRLPKLNEWCARGATEPERRVVKSSLGLESQCEAENLKFAAKYEDLKKNHTQWNTFMVDDAELIIVAFGIASRICRKAIKLARQENIRVGLIQPITLFPFPTDVISEFAKKGCRFLVAEMNLGQMVSDVELAVNGAADVRFYGRSGGFVLSPEEILSEIRKHVSRTS
ncbi:MAG: 3-methyl-2-oxobutanoate dehydrogenase subunit VorB [Desulfobacteraceae bacterium]|nr:3-methyl-2-oxobutanoate dehydrogenase subunit VorB [Desulfobacteraceae bacterium]